MKITSMILGSTAFLTLTASVVAQTEVRITGSTAFRAAANQAIINALGGSATQYAYVGSTIGGASRGIFEGTINGQPYIVYTNFSGSTAGISQIADQSTTTGWVSDSNPRSTAGTMLPATYTSESATADLSFSDVDKTLSNNPTAPLGGGPVGVVAFQFVAQQGADALVPGFNNVTDQMVEAIYALGSAPASFLTGNPANSGTTVFASGRDNGSGTRATVLAETGFGVFRTVNQVQVAANGAITQFPQNAGYGGSGDMRSALQVPASTNTIGGNSVPAFILGYVGAADTTRISNYDEATGTFDANSPIPLSYNGVRYSKENVRNGSYTLWGFQQLFTRDGITPAQLTFDAALRDAIPAQLGGDGVLSIPELNVTRSGGDGGPVAPL